MIEHFKFSVSSERRSV